MVGYGIIPMRRKKVIVDEEQTIMLMMGISTVGIYGVMLGGYASRSKYSIIGSIRSGAQMVSYEVALGIILSVIVISTGTVNMSEIKEIQKETRLMWPMWGVGIILLISAIAETNRHPFDLPEAEAELVAGYYVEYSGMGFGMYYIGECATVLIMSWIWTIIMTSGKGVWIIVWIIIWIRAALPRYRYDQLIYIGWGVLIPISLGMLSTMTAWNIIK